MEEKIKIVANKEAFSREISDLKDIANSCGIKNFSVKNSGRNRELGAFMPPEIWIFIGLTIATGFLSAIGSDLWKGIKKFVLKCFKYYENPKEPVYNPDIYIEISEKDKPKIQILLPTQNFKEQELEESLEKLDVILKNYKLKKSSTPYFYQIKYLQTRKWKSSVIK
jgi:hypothetical protein